MEIWLVFSLATLFIESTARLIQKEALNHNNSLESTIYFQFVSGIPAVIASFLFFRPIPADIGTWVIVLVICVFSSLFNIAYFFLMKREDFTQFAIFQQLGVLWSVFGGVLFLAESMTIHKVSGVFLIIAGVIIAKWKKSEGQPKGISGIHILFFLLFALAAVSGILTKKLIGSFSVPVFAAVMQIVPGIMIATFACRTVGKIKPMLIPNRKNILLFVFTLALGIAFMSHFAALKYGGELSRVAAVRSASPILMVVLGILFLKGERQGIPQKIIGAIAAASGILFLRY